jgi:hypothetical protein
MRQYPKRLKAIGGYIALQFPKKATYYPQLIELNTARNSFEYLLKVNHYTAVFLPYYTCEVMLEPIKRLGITYFFYTIDKNLDPIIDFKIGETECFLYTNYFGIKCATVEKLSKKINNLIIDNSQAFFVKPLPKIDTIYSCRKFFGVPDGAYLQSNKLMIASLEKDISFNRMLHLLKSIDVNIEFGYQSFINNNEALSNNNIKVMSKLTHTILESIDYEDDKQIRNRNFKILHHELSSKNKLTIDLNSIDGPICYPLLIDKDNVRVKLINKRIFVPIFWPNVLKWTTEKMFENHLTKNLLAIPIDQRYNEQDMLHIINYLKQML